METTRAIEFDATSPVTFSSFNAQLNVVLVYEDFEMGVQGKRVFDLIAKEAGGESAARLTVWRFDFFHSAELTLAVCRQAEEADVIIVAPRDPDHLPPQVKAWLERWPQRRKAKAGALVAVFHPSISSNARSSDVALLLLRAAARAEMDFFYRRPDASSPMPEATTPATSTTTPQPQDATTVTYTVHAAPYRGWGLNE